MIRKEARYAGNAYDQGRPGAGAVPSDELLTAMGRYWILQVKSMDDAVEWARRAPFEALSRIYPGEYGAHGEIEIRQVFEPESSDASN
jgi:hypothetical protein